MENADRKCRICRGMVEREHVKIDGRVVCPYREIVRNNLRQFYCEGFHKLAEVTANRLGLELDLPEKSLLERLAEPEEGREETPANLPPVGPWDPDFLEGRRASPHTTDERVADHTSNPPTLLAGSDGITISHGTAFEYWSRRSVTLHTGTLGALQAQSETGLQEGSENLGIIHDERQTVRFEDRFQKTISTYQSKATAIAFSVDSQNIATVREAVAYDGFRSIIIDPTSPADLPLIVIGRHAAALEQITELLLLKAQAKRGFWALDVHKIVKIPYLVSFLVAIVLLAATWYYRRL